MSQEFLIALTFIAFLVLFTIVGIYSATQKQNTTGDYLLASRKVNPWLIALSSMATGQSGFLFTAQVGYAYTVGISGIWITIGWAIGDYLAWWFVFNKLRSFSEEVSAETVSSFLGQDSFKSSKDNSKYNFPWKKQPKSDRLIVIISAIITIAFLGSYAAAQLIAGSKALHSVFGWNYHLGIVVGAIVVVIYCFSGGIRASIWTDSVQAIIMMVSLLLLLVVGMNYIGGFGQLWQSLAQIDSSLVNWSPSEHKFGFIAFFLGWVAAGFGAVGQPHIMIRAMAIDSVNNLAFARNFKLICASIASFSSIFIGLAGRVIIPDLSQGGDSELILPYLSLDLLPVILVGLMLAGLFSATISTADSQILSCSAALTQDIFPARGKSYNFLKLGTLTVTAIVLIIALADDGNVFDLITFSWSILASSLGPILLVRVWQLPLTTPVGIAMMGIGMTAAFIWKQLGLSGAIYEVLPGFLASIGFYLVFLPFTNKKNLEKHD